jgi:hypothetical protein
MTITVIDPVVGTAAATPIGPAVPASTTRKFTKCTAYNGTGATVSIKVYLVPDTRVADTTTCYVDYDLQARETYLCPEVVGAALKANGTVQVLGLGVTFSAVASDTSN